MMGGLGLGKTCPPLRLNRRRTRLNEKQDNSSRQADRQAGRKAHMHTQRDPFPHPHLHVFRLTDDSIRFFKKIGSTAETAAGRGSEHGVCELGHIPTQASAATTISGGEFCIQAHELPPTLATTSLTTHPLTHSPLHTFDFFIWNWDLVVVCCSGIDIQIATKKLHLL